MRFTQICYTTAQIAQRSPKHHPARKFFKTTHCLFDLDGTLLDTQRYYEFSFKEIFRKYDIKFTARWYNKMLQLSATEFWKQVRDVYRLTSSSFLLQKECEEIYKRHVEGVPLKLGVDKLISHLYNSQIPMAIVTSSNKEIMESKTKHLADFMAMFNHVVCGEGNDNVKRPKPNPDIYFACASRFLERPVYGNCLAFEDTPRGIASALAASMQCVAILNQHVPEELCKGATVVINSFKEFEPEIFGLPPYMGAR